MVLPFKSSTKFWLCQRIYTDANLYDPKELVVITESADQILGDLENKARDENIELAPDVELVLEIFPQEENLLCGYYFVEHSSRCLFWLEDFDAEEICQKTQVVVSLSHLRESALYGGTIRTLLILW